MEILRTAEERFEGLKDFAFAPRYAQVSHGACKYRMHFLDEGDPQGQVLVCFHGQAAWAYIYRAMVPLFTAAGFRVIAPDLIGFGRSDKPDDQTEFTLGTHVDFLRQLFEQLSLQNVHAFCHDWGSYFAMRLLADQPAAFDRLVFSNSGSLVSDEAGRAWFEEWRARMLGLTEFPISALVQDRSARTLSAAELTAYDAPFPDEAYKAGPRRLPMIHPLVAQAREAVSNTLAWDHMGAWLKPILLLFSAESARGSMSPEVFLDHVPGTAGQQHKAFHNASFFIQEDEAEQLAERTILFLKDH